MDVPLQLTMAIGAAHRNQYLFSDHYLDNLLPQDLRWESARPEAQAFLTWLQEQYAQERHLLPDYNETQLEEHWFKPILGVRRGTVGGSTGAGRRGTRPAGAHGRADDGDVQPVRERGQPRQGRPDHE